MYSLVKFVEDNILYITSSKNITPIDTRLVWAPYKSMGFYEAKIISTSNNKLTLNKLLREKKSEEIGNISQEIKQQNNLQETTAEIIASCETGGSVNETSLASKITRKRYNLIDRSNESTLDADIDSFENGTILASDLDVSEIVTKSETKNLATNINTDEWSKVNLLPQKRGKGTGKNTTGVRKENFKKETATKKNKVTDKWIQSDTIRPLKNNINDYSENFIKKKLNRPEKNVKKLVDNENILKDEENVIQQPYDNKRSNGNIEFIHCEESTKKLEGNEEKRIHIKHHIVWKPQDKEKLNINSIKNCSKKNLMKVDSNESSIISGDSIHQKSTEEEIEHIQQREIKKSTHKQHCCYFCKKLLFQLPRHFLNVHFKEIEVKEILSLHPNNPERINKINELRKKGDFAYNKDIREEKKIVIRDSNMNNTKYLPCPSCLGYFRTDSLRHHRKRCSPHEGNKSLQSNSRKLTNYIHERASHILKNCIASSMYQDEISNHFLFDEMIVLYGNYLCIKYTESHLKNYIRAQLRLLGRFMQQIKVEDPKIKCCKDLMHPIHIDTIRKSIDFVAGLNSSTGIYEHPTNARTLSTEFKKIIEVVQSECDKKEDEHLMKLTKALSRRCKLELTPYINRICKLSENKFKRTKKRDTILPENIEIEKYLDYLLEKVSIHYENLKKKYSYEDWNRLNQYTLVFLVVFNRKRPGETQRIELEDYYKKEAVSKKEMQLLDDAEKHQADKYIRVAFRGKLGNSTALLIDKNKILPGIEILVKNRLAAGVHQENRFLFAYPSKDKSKTYDAYRCHRQILEESGIKSISLTFTSLRKQFATEVAKGGPSHEDELRISNYMSHNYNIHKNIYDQSTSIVDITKVSRHLEASATNKKDVLKQQNKEQNLDLEQLGQFNQRKSGSINERKRQSNRSVKDDYSPSSTSEEEELNPVVQERLGVYKKRKLWSSDEKKAVRNYFQYEITNMSAIDRSKIKKFKFEHSGLMKTRSVEMINQWLQGEILRIQRIEDGVPEKRPRYSTPEIEILESSVERHSLDASQPSLEEAQSIIDSNDILKKRSSLSVLMKIRNLLKHADH